MLNSEKLNDWVDNFSWETSCDASFDLYNNFSIQYLSESVNSLWNKFSDIYYISCSPFNIEAWKDYPEIYEILKRYKHTAEGRPLEILIWAYNQETIDYANKRTEELRKIYDCVDGPKRFMHIVWFYWWTSWRTIQVIISEFKKQFPKKIKTITPDNLK